MIPILFVTLFLLFTAALACLGLVFAQGAFDDRVRPAPVSVRDDSRRGAGGR